MRIRTLIVDDEPLGRRGLLRFLKNDPEIEVVAQCGDGESAVAAIHSRNPDLVFLDIQMPEMDGFEATAGIRAKEIQSGKHTPVVAMTAHAMKGDRERCLLNGMDDYISKPVDRKELAQVLERQMAAIPAQPVEVAEVLDYRY